MMAWCQDEHFSIDNAQKIKTHLHLQAVFQESGLLRDAGQRVFSQSLKDFMQFLLYHKSVICRA